MMRFTGSRFACFSVCLGLFVVLGLAMGAGTATAQAQRPALPGAAPPGEKMSSGMLEGSVKKVDPGAGTISVSSGPLGMLGKTLAVTDTTQIRVEGRQGTLADIREGAKVKASYESHDGTNVATQIDVMPAPASGSGGLPAKSQ